MGKALVLKSVDFSSVAIEKVTIGDEIPCTAIEIDQSSVSIDTLEQTAQLTATATPANTTDSVLWTSSEPLVASVDSNGVITAHGIGTATITVTCGIQTDTITVTFSSMKAPYSLKSVADRYPGSITVGSDKIMGVQANSNQFVLGQPYHAENVDLRVYAGVDYEVECIRVPYGATKIKIATTDGVAVSISYTYVVDTETLIEYNSAEYPKYLREQTFVNTNNGYDVEYGEAVIFRPVGASQHDTLSYVYFT